MDWRRTAFTEDMIRLAERAVDRLGVRDNVRRLARDYWRHHDDTIATASQGTQILLTMAYQDRAESGALLPSFSDVEFRMYSQNGEDGILLYLFSLLGESTKKVVELGAGNGSECNGANLIINRGWRGLLFDGDEENVKRGQQFYATGPNTSWYPPTMAHAWITRENVNELIADRGFEGGLDLLSIDLDGIDYWIWKALDCVQPVVVVAEYNWTWGPVESKTIPYDPGFVLPPLEGRSYEDNIYFGASLNALVGLGREKGYRLVGTNRWGFNAFFLQNGVGEQWFPEVKPEDCFDTPVMRSRWNSGFISEHQSREWISV